MTDISAMSLDTLEARINELRRDGRAEARAETEQAAEERSAREDVLMALTSVPVGAERAQLEAAVRAGRLTSDEVELARSLIAAALDKEAQADRDGDAPDMYTTWYCQLALDTLERWKINA